MSKGTYMVCCVSISKVCHLHSEFELPTCDIFSYKFELPTCHITIFLMYFTINICISVSKIAKQLF
jgi:hypothetical protein